MTFFSQVDVTSFEATEKCSSNPLTVDEVLGPKIGKEWNESGWALEEKVSAFKKKPAGVLSTELKSFSFQGRSETTKQNNNNSTNNNYSYNHHSANANGQIWPTSQCMGKWSDQTRTLGISSKTTTKNNSNNNNNNLNNHKTP